jgi:hypothetical protein
VWAERISEAERARFRALIPPDSQLPPDAWLTVFEDDSSPRPGTDEIYFAPAQQQEVVQPPPLIRTVDRTVPIPLDLLLLLFGGVLLWLRLRQRRRLAA